MAELEADEIAHTGEDVVLAGVRKIYGPVTVLDVESLAFRRGEVVGLVGENGAGKSTMMGILSGSVTPDAGRVSVAGRYLGSGGTIGAQVLGIAMVSQEFPLVGQMTVAENLLLGRRPSRQRFVVDRVAMETVAAELLDDVGVKIPTSRSVESLSVAERQMIEIAKAWGRRPLVLILDEPTSALGPAESAHVLELAKRHAENGGIVVFVGHRLDEVRTVADRVVVLRNGQVVADLTPGQATEQRIVREMVGADVFHVAALEPPQDRGVPAFEAIDIGDGRVGPLSISLLSGEVVGIAGLMGSGRSHLLHLVMGAKTRTSGSMRIAGQDYDPRTPGDAVAAGIGLVPEDRKTQALLMDASIRWNTTLATVKHLARASYLSPRADKSAARRIVDLAQVRCQSSEQPIRALSGGNQQRAIFGRWMAADPKVLLLDEPTRGVDVGAKSEIYRLIEEARRQGMALLVVSSELDELLEICHRIIVMRHGRIADELERSAFSKERIIAAAAIDRVSAR